MEFIAQTTPVVIRLLKSVNYAVERRELAWRSRHHWYVIVGSSDLLLRLLYRFHVARHI